ncbi:hypothetical protein FB446DRAFT_781311, partial [Lentinula raphanica]
MESRVSCFFLSSLAVTLSPSLLPFFECGCSKGPDNNPDHTCNTMSTGHFDFICFFDRLHTPNILLLRFPLVFVKDAGLHPLSFTHTHKVSFMLGLIIGSIRCVCICSVRDQAGHGGIHCVLYIPHHRLLSFQDSEMFICFMKWLFCQYVIVCIVLKNRSFSLYDLFVVSPSVNYCLSVSVWSLRWQFHVVTLLHSSN